MSVFFMISGISGQSPHPCDLVTFLHLPETPPVRVDQQNLNWDAGHWKNSLLFHLN